MRTENFNLPLEIIPRLKAWAIRPAPINPIGIFKNLFFFCFLHWKLEFLWVLFTSVKGGSHVVEGWIEPAQAGAFKIDERYHAARECSAFFTIETKRSGKLPNSARAERHNFILSGKTYITFSTKFLCIFPCVIISCKRTKFSSNELLEKFDNIRKRRNKCIIQNFTVISLSVNTFADGWTQPPLIYCLDIRHYKDNFRVCVILLPILSKMI